MHGPKIDGGLDIYGNCPSFGTMLERNTDINPNIPTIDIPL